MVLWCEDSADQEESIRKERGSGPRDSSTAEGLVRLRKRFQESVPSKKERLHDLLQKVWIVTILIKRKV